MGTRTQAELGAFPKVGLVKVRSVVYGRLNLNLETEKGQPVRVLSLALQVCLLFLCCTAIAVETDGSLDSRTLGSVEIFRVKDGGPSSLGALGLGRQPILFVLWATWCEPCLKEMPILRELHERYGKHVRFIGIAQDLNSPSNRRTVRELTEPARLNYPQFLEKDGPTMVARMFGPSQTKLPAFVLFGATGKKLYSHVGSLDTVANRENLVAEIHRLTGL